MSDERDPEEVPAEPAPFPPFGVHSSERLYDYHWCGLRRDQVILPNGQLQEYHVFEIPDAVAIVPVRSDGRVVLVGQYRYPSGETHWEVPAGRIDEGEAAADAAQRELLEECGYRAKELRPLPGFQPTGGISPHFVHAFCGLDCEWDRNPQPEPSEQIIVQDFSKQEIVALLEAGSVRDGFTAVTLLYALQLGLLG